MKIKYLFSVLLLALALPAAAEFRTVAEAYEVQLSNLRLPRSAGSTVSFKTCDACAYQTIRVTADTSWTVNGRAMSLDKFRDRIAALEDRDDKTLTVLHHLEDDQVLKVSITLR